MFTRLCLRLLLFVSLIFSALTCGGYNLFGIPGNGYQIDVELGHPPQRFKLLMDTGSSNLAVAAVDSVKITNYFHYQNSTTLHNTGKQVEAEFSRGKWWGNVSKDVTVLPSLSSTYAVRSDIVLIDKQYDFFMEEQSYKEYNWQGILGLAYPPISVSNSLVTAEPWLDSIDTQLGLIISFELSLCGVISPTNLIQYGRFSLMDDSKPKPKQAFNFSTPILKEDWYEIAVLNVRVVQPVYIDLPELQEDHVLTPPAKFLRSEELNETCQILNLEKSIVDCGTTNLRLPTKIFQQVIDDLRYATYKANISLPEDGFWLHGQPICWLGLQKFNLPNVAIDILDVDDENQYYSLELPPESYIRLIYSKPYNETYMEYCYKLGIEGHVVETVLGVTAMEGFQIIFNRSAAIVTFSKSECGPNVTITGPYRLNESIFDLCKLDNWPPITIDITLQIAQVFAVVVLILTFCLLLYLLTAGLRRKLFYILHERLYGPHPDLDRLA